MSKKSTKPLTVSRRLRRLKKRLKAATRRLVERLGLLLSSDRRRAKEHRATLSLLLWQMRLQERALARRYAEEPDEKERARLERRLQVLHQQRKKGLDLAKEMDRHDD